MSIPLKFSGKKSFNIQELLHCKSKCHETKLMHPSSLRAFQTDQEHNLKHPSSVDLRSTNKTKQNKTKQTNKTSFIDRCLEATNEKELVLMNFLSMNKGRSSKSSSN